MNHFLGLIDDTRLAFSHGQHTLPRCVSFQFMHTSAATNHADEIKLTAALLFHEQHIDLVVAELDDSSLLKDIALSPTEYFLETQLRLKTKPIRISQPLALNTVKIDKPWGEEIWYTGIEARGICTVQDTPLDRLLAAASGSILGHSTYKDPILLKILAPNSAASDDLYFELHEKKIEVYIVTHIDLTAWPDGIGKIRYGFNQERLNSLGATKFKIDYAAAVKEYEVVRRKIDADSEQHQALLQQEQQLQQQMYAFTQLESVALGDVIRVEPLVPHSLQHGVRVVEFQSAHYERHILSFTQQVLTQNHWDTDAALKIAQLDQSIDLKLEVIEQGPNHKTELVADFPDFKALRITLQANSEIALPLEYYGVAIGVSGQPKINEQSLQPESALFLPQLLKHVSIQSHQDQVVVLIALATPTRRET